MLIRPGLQAYAFISLCWFLCHCVIFQTACTHWREPSVPQNIHAPIGRFKWPKYYHHVHNTYILSIQNILWILPGVHTRQCMCLPVHVWFHQNACLMQNSIMPGPHGCPPASLHARLHVRTCTHARMYERMHARARVGGWGGTGRGISVGTFVRVCMCV